MIALLFAAQILCAQQPEGTIRSTVDAVQSDGLHLPEGVTIYDAPNGNIVGTIQSGNIVKNGDALPMLPELVTHAGDYQYFERQSGYVRFYSDADHYWLKESELEDQGYQVVEE